MEFNLKDPISELRHAVQRNPTVDAERCKFTSCQGRVLCVIKIAIHTIGLVVKPLLYLAAMVVVLALAVFKLMCLQNPCDGLMVAGLLILSALVAPIGQIIRIAKAFAGVFHPGAYFRFQLLADQDPHGHGNIFAFNNPQQLFAHVNPAPQLGNIKPLCRELAKLAKDANCKTTIVDALQEADTILAPKLQECSKQMQDYFIPLFERDFKIIIEKFKDPHFPNDQKVELLTPLEPNKGDSSGLITCSTGVAKLLEQICGRINVPKEPKELFSYMRTQYSEVLIELMIAQAATTKKLPEAAQAEWHRVLNEHDVHETNQVNGIIVLIGKSIGLPKEMIENAKRDSYAAIANNEENRALLDGAYQILYIEQGGDEGFYQYLQTRINSDGAGDPGLEEFRKRMRDKLAELVVPVDIQADKAKIAETFGIDEDDVTAEHYVMYHHCLPPYGKLDLKPDSIKHYFTLRNP